MKWILGIGALLVVVILLARRARAASSGELGVDSATGRPYPPNSLFGLIAAGKMPFNVEYPPPISGDSRDAKSGGWNVSSACKSLYGYNGAAVSAVPDKNTKYVVQANTVLSDINCGAIGYAEKAIGKAYSTIRNLF